MSPGGGQSWRWTAPRPALNAQRTLKEGRGLSLCGHPLLSHPVRLLLLCVRRCGPDAEAAGAPIWTPFWRRSTPWAESWSGLERAFAPSTWEVVRPPPCPPPSWTVCSPGAGRSCLWRAAPSIPWRPAGRTPIDRAKLEVLKGHGVGRISINPQTLEDHVLRAIGRKHAAGDIRAANDLARSVGFDCINMDLIAGLPQDSCEGFRRSLEGAGDGAGERHHPHPWP